MRSSKSRSRSKSNRPRTIGNIINRVFDSSGPEGKVRGTPQQIIDKYLTLSRDAQLSNDRVATENFQQHAEHYTRMLGEAMREMAAEQDQRRETGSQNGNQNGTYSVGQNGSQNGGPNGSQNGTPHGQSVYRDRPARDDAPEGARGSTVIDLADDGDDTGLVETPETRNRAAMARGDQSDRAPQAERQERVERPSRAEGAERTERAERPERQDRRSERPRFAPGERKEEVRPPQDAAAQARPEDAEPGLPRPVESLAPMMPSFATLPEEAQAEPKPATARRPRAPRKPKATGGSSNNDPAEAAE